jgi:hypothetical protein
MKSHCDISFPLQGKKLSHGNGRVTFTMSRLMSRRHTNLKSAYYQVDVVPIGKILKMSRMSRTRTASLSQDDDDIPTVHSISDGFRVVAAQYGPDFQCTTCALRLSDDECVQRLALLIEHRDNKNFTEIVALIARLAVPIEG